MKDKIVKLDPEGKWRLEVSTRRGTDTRLKSGFRLVRLSEVGQDMTQNTLCAVPERYAQRLLHEAPRIAPTLKELLRGLIRMQERWIELYHRRFNDGFYASWTGPGLNLQLHWIRESSVEAFNFLRKVEDPLFSTEPLAVNSAIWIEGSIPNQRTFLGLVPLDELIRLPASTLLASILSGKPQGVIAWKYSGMGHTGWQFPQYTPAPYRDAIVKTTWRICDLPKM